jgi:site-specific recombinase XerD
VLRSLVERQEDARGETLFGLGYWAGCRISDVAWLRIEHLHIGPKVGWVHVGYKGGKMRDIDLLNPVRRPLYTYFQQADRDQDSPYVFSSQRAARFTEAGIHHWFRWLKARANKEEWSLTRLCASGPRDWMDHRGGGLLLGPRDQKGYTRDSNHRPLHPG